MGMLIEAAERGWLPDSFIRLGIRRLVKRRLHEELRNASRQYPKLLQELSRSHLALHTEDANKQHYEVSSDFFKIVLGSALKYSSGYWPTGTATLDQAELDMLDLYVDRAQLCDGQRVLDLGCGWGSFTLWAAQIFPKSRFTAVSNSKTQKLFIEKKVRERGLTNIQVITADINELQLSDKYDRVVSVEMFEHVRNYQELLKRISGWLDPTGILFVHIFCHKELMYPFETKGKDDWMGRHFFTGGLMPSADTFSHFNEDLRIESSWLLPGTHYEKTSRAWLEKLDNNQKAARDALIETYGKRQIRRWIGRWRLFFMACEELFGHAQGKQWQVAHYRFKLSE